jgi:hypothetical protein
MSEGHPVPISSVLAAGVGLRPHEAVAVVLELCRRLGDRRESAGVTSAISASTVTIDRAGRVAVSGGMPHEVEQTISMAGHLLLEMLDHPASANTSETAVPPRLRSTAERAAWAGEAAFSSVGQLLGALRRHGPDYGETRALQDVFARWTARAAGTGPAAAGPPQIERRRAVPPPDIMRRFLREADEEAYRARVEASSRPAAAGTAADAPQTSRSRLRRLVLVAAMLVALAGVAFAVLLDKTPEDLPVVPPASKPTPVQPRREPGWELLGKPERSVANPSPDRRAAGPQRRPGEARALTAATHGELPVSDR